MKSSGVTNMSMLTGKRNQLITWWPVTGSDGMGGDTFGTPTTMYARWQETQQKFIGPIDKQEQVSQAIVYLDETKSVAYGDYLALGNLTANASPTHAAFKIQRLDRHPDLRNLQTVLRAVL